MTSVSSLTDWDKGWPVFNEARCVHSHAAGASCSACADVCPNGALTLGEDALELDVDACDGCALCVAACPQEVIDSKFGRIDVASLRKGATAYLACERSGVARDRQSMPCVHALSWRHALRLHRAGVREIAAVVGDCHNCPARSARLEHTMVHVNEVLSTSRLPGLQFRYLEKTQWEIEVRGVSPADGISSRRRAFLRRFVDPVGVEQESEVPATVATLLGESVLVDGVYPAVPLIDRERCDGCDACVRVCRTGALALIEDEAKPRYSVDASRCTGCNLCSDVCQPHAVSVSRWTTSTQRMVDLNLQRCPRCGVAYHAPKLRPDNLCNICATTHHRRNLFQVDPA